MATSVQALSPTSSQASFTPVSTPILPNFKTEYETTPLRDETLIAGPSRSTLSKPNGIDHRNVAKGGAIVPGSGDGTECGEECFMWTDLVMNKPGSFRYAFCGPSPNSSPSPHFPFYRTVPGPPQCPPVHLSPLDRSSFLRMSPSGLTVTSDRGFRSGRANISVRQGSWYFETLVLRGSGPDGAGKTTGGDIGNAHVRVGWARREANVEGPVGMDAYSYGLRDVGGDKVHLSRPKAYGRGFKTGDVVGCLITLPKRTDDINKMKRSRLPLKYKGQHYFEMDEYLVQKEMEALVDREGKVAAAAKAAAEAAREAAEEDKVKVKKGATAKSVKKTKKGPEQPAGPSIRDLPILPGSKVEFYLNGEPLGTAFEDLYDFAPLPPAFNITTPSSKRSVEKDKDVQFDDGTMGYYPMVSCFGRGKVKVNFGPEWIKTPIELDARPMSERWDEFREEERVLDERDEADMTERLIKDMAAEEERRKAAEARAKLSLKNGVKKEPVRKKQRKGTDTPGETPMGTPTPAPEVSTPQPEPSMEIKMEDGVNGVKVEADEVPVYLALPLVDATPAATPPVITDEAM